MSGRIDLRGSGVRGPGKLRQRIDRRCHSRSNRRCNTVFGNLMIIVDRGRNSVRGDFFKG